MIKVLHWILGVLAALSLITSVILHLIFSISRTVFFSTTAAGALQFTMACCFASIALSLIELSSK